MFKAIHNLVWAFDMEWAPDPKAGRLLYKLPEDMPDAEVMAEMWRQNGATPENPMPYLKTVMCQILSIAMVMRHATRDGSVSVHLLSLPKLPLAADPPQDNAAREAGIVLKFLQSLGERQPQLVGYNSHAADIRALVQRGIILGLQASQFCNRPNKPWEGVDYFAKGSERNIDLKDVVTPGWGPGSPSLNEIAVLSGIPGKMDVDGQQVPTLWLENRLPEIIAYNECDALTTYLVWLRVAHFAGYFSSDQYQLEQQRVHQLLTDLYQQTQAEHLLRYQKHWDYLKGKCAY